MRKNIKKIGMINIILLVILIISVPVQAESFKTSSVTEIISESKKEWRIKFNQLIDESPESIEKNALVEIKDYFGNVEQCDYIVDGKEIIVVPKYPYFENLEYTLIVNRGIKSKSNKTLDEKVEKQFIYLSGDSDYPDISIPGDGELEDDGYSKLEGEDIKISGNITFMSQIEEDSNLIIRAKYIEKTSGD